MMPIKQPDPGLDYELCLQSQATDATMLNVACNGWLPWEPMGVWACDCEPHLYRYRRRIQKPEKSPARLETEAKATNELSREFLLATLVEIVTAWDECDGPLMMTPEKGVPRFTKAICVASAIVFGEGKRIP